jgi:hypothetical protein
MSQGCPPGEILGAMGLKWRDVLGGELTPEARQKIKDQEYLKILETRWMAYEILSVIGWENHDFWVYQASKTDYEICYLKAKMGLL